MLISKEDHKAFQRLFNAHPKQPSILRIQEGQVLQIAAERCLPPKEFTSSLSMIESLVDKTHKISPEWTAWGIQLENYALQYLRRSPAMGGL